MLYFPYSYPCSKQNIKADDIFYVAEMYTIQNKSFLQFRKGFFSKVSVFRASQFTEVTILNILAIALLFKTICTHVADGWTITLDSKINMTSCGREITVS